MLISKESNTNFSIKRGKWVTLQSRLRNFTQVYLAKILMGQYFL